MGHKDRRPPLYIQLSEIDEPSRPCEGKGAHNGGETKPGKWLRGELQGWAARVERRGVDGGENGDAGKGGEEMKE